MKENVDRVCKNNTPMMRARIPLRDKPVGEIVKGRALRSRDSPAEQRDETMRKSVIQQK